MLSIECDFLRLSLYNCPCNRLVESSLCNFKYGRLKSSQRKKILILIDRTWLAYLYSYIRPAACSWLYRYKYIYMYVYRWIQVPRSAAKLKQNLISFRSLAQKFDIAYIYTARLWKCVWISYNYSETKTN